jgi:prepilin-type N-terminal cleavage/methylation domain-containing protein
MSKYTSRQAGFTLPELLIAMIVAVFMSAVIIGFMDNGLRANVIAQAQQQLLSNAQLGLDYAAKDIRLSANADDTNRWPDANAPNPADQYSWQSDGSTLILATAAQDASSNILFDDPSKYITAKDNHIYFVSNGTLYRRILASTISGNAAVTTCPPASASSSCPVDKTVLQNVSSFTVIYIDGSGNQVTPSNARSILLSVTLDIHKYNQDVTASYQEQMVFRNK